jgi:hypothetical protein
VLQIGRKTLSKKKNCRASEGLTDNPVGRGIRGNLGAHGDELCPFKSAVAIIEREGAQ